jgi:simple sugar transport system permease protein
MIDFLTLIQVLDSSLRLATPLLLVCLAGLFSERAGIFDIGLEGKLLAAAFVSAAFAAITGSVWLGLLAGILASIMLSLLHGLASITLRGDQIISGVAINFLAAGLTVVVAQDLFGQGGRTPPLKSGGRFEPINFPGATSSKEINDTGPLMQLYSELFSGHSLLVYIALLTVPISWFVLYKTRYGLRLRAVGENPAAVDTAGISVIGLRYSAVVIGGILCGIAGAYIATSLQANFTKDMSAGRGFIALAALIFAKWRPWYALGACLLFGFFFAVDTRFQNILLPAWALSGFLIVIALGLLSYVWKKDFLDKVVLGGLALGISAIAIMVVFSVWNTGTDSQIKIPVVFIQSLPYILTVVVLAGFVGKAIPPRAGGQPYVKER